MEIERTDNGTIYFYVDKEYLKKYGLEIETFRNRKPFRSDIFDSLLENAEKEYGAKFSECTMPENIIVKSNIVIFEVKEKSNIVQMENDYIEDERLARNIWELFRTLPDEKLHMGIMDVDEKRKLLEQIRNDESMQYIWENFIY